VARITSSGPPQDHRKVDAPAFNSRGPPVVGIARPGHLVRDLVMNNSWRPEEVRRSTRCQLAWASTVFPGALTVNNTGRHELAAAIATGPAGPARPVLTG